MRKGGNKLCVTKRTVVEMSQTQLERSSGSQWSPNVGWHFWIYTNKRCQSRLVFASSLLFLKISSSMTLVFISPQKHQLKQPSPLPLHSVPREHRSSSSDSRCTAAPGALKHAIWQPAKALFIWSVEQWNADKVDHSDLLWCAESHIWSSCL